MSNSDTSPGSEMQSAVLYWVVQRDAQTDVLITFRSFRDHAGAEGHKAELESVSDDKRSKVTIETLPEPTNFLESLFGDMDSEEDTQLGPALGALGVKPSSLNSISPELAGLLRKANRLRAVFDRPMALVMPFDLEIR